MRQYGLLALLSWPLLSSAAVTNEFSLDNGLKVVVREDQRSPVVVTQMWYKIGSSYEPYGITGISHALEHMMFKGTPTVPAGEFSRLVSYLGGEDNAFTTDDYTAYYQLYSNNRLPLALELEADRMANLVLKKEDFDSEIKVVMEERRQRTEGRIAHRLWRRSDRRSAEPRRADRRQRRRRRSEGQLDARGHQQRSYSPRRQ